MKDFKFVPIHYLFKSTKTLPEISPFNILEAAYIVQNSYKSFPVNTIHIIGVDSELTPENKHLVIKFEGQYFICAANGIMSMACLNIEPEEIVEINIDNYGNVITNITKSFFREISKARDFDISVRNYKFKKIFSKYSDIVNFNIAEEKRNNDGQAMAIFNSNSNLEIAIYKSNPVNFGTAASLMGLNILDTVTVNFK